MMNNPVPESGSGNFPCFWVADGEDGKRLWLVGVREEFPLQGGEVVFEVLLKVEDIPLFRLAFLCIQKSQKKVIIAA